MYVAFTPYGRTSQTFPLSYIHVVTVRTPLCTHRGLGSFHFARRYFGNRCFFLFLRLLRCFSSAGSLPQPMYSVTDDRGSLCRVSPFRHLRVTGYLLLTAAFRSLSRLSSALSAKASTLRSSSLYFKSKSERFVLFLSNFTFFFTGFCKPAKFFFAYSLSVICCVWIFSCLITSFSRCYQDVLLIINGLLIISRYFKISFFLYEVFKVHLAALRAA